MGVTFTEKETTEILNLKAEEHYSESLAAKILMTGIVPESTTTDVLPRNLTALLQKAYTE